MNHSEQLDKLASALAKAQGLIEGAKQDSDNPYFKSKYADLHTVMKACKQPLADNGLSIVMTYEVENDKNYLTTMLLHESGQWIKGKMLIPVGKPDAQSLGAATTYCRRFSLSALVGISTYDDDGEEASKPHREQPARHMTKPEGHKTPELKSEGLPGLRDLQKVVCGKGLLVGEDDVEQFLTVLVEKYPTKTKQELLSSALSSDEQKDKFADSMMKWKNK